MEERKRPYLGRHRNPDYVVLFPSNERDIGIIVLSEVDNPDFAVGVMSEFDENSFEYMDSDDSIRLNND